MAPGNGSEKQVAASKKEGRQVLAKRSAPFFKKVGSFCKKGRQLFFEQKQTAFQDEIELAPETRTSAF